MEMILQLSKNRNHYSFSLDGKLIADLRYNERSSSFRVNASTKRLFFIEQSRLLHKVFLKSEYGIEIGEWSRAGSFKNGSLQLNENTFSYTISKEGIHLTGNKQVFVLLLNTGDALEFAKEEFAAILFSLAWISKETVKEKVHQPLRFK